MSKRIVLWAASILLVAGCTATVSDQEDTRVPGQLTDPSEIPTPGALPEICYTTDFFSRHVLELDMASETVKELPFRLDSVSLNSLGLIKKHLVACSEENGIVHILDLATGTRSEVDGLGCNATTAIGDKIYLQSLRRGTLTEYTGLDALVANEPSRTLPRPFASRLGAGAGRLLAAWHSTDHLLAVDLETGDTEPVALPDYDGWILGIAETPTVRMIVRWFTDRGVYLYDTVTGEPTGQLFNTLVLKGLACTQ